MRYYLDEDLSARIAVIARDRFGLDVVATREINMNRASDEAQLSSAALDDRCIITRNAKDFVPLTRMFQEAEAPHAGVLIVPNSIPGDALLRIAHALHAHHQAFPDGVPRYYVDYLRASSRS